MNRIIEDEVEKEHNDLAIRTVEQLPSRRPPAEYRPQRNSNNKTNHNICSSKQTLARKYQLKTNRSTSLPSRQSFPPQINSEENGKQRRRYASDSNHNDSDLTTSLVTSFLQYLRSELRATTNARKKNSLESLNYSSDILAFSTKSTQQQYSIDMSSASSSTSSQSIIPSLTTDHLCKNTFDDENEILTLINLLILRVECLDNEPTKNRTCPTIKQVDQNLIEYLYYLFNKFLNDDTDRSAPMIGKTNFVNVCQTLARHGCFNMSSSTSPDHSYSESTLTNSSERTLTQTSIREYRPEQEDITLPESSINERRSSTMSTINDQETWLIVDLELVKPEYSATTPEESKCLLQSPTSDDPLLLSNENYFSFEEIKSCGSESSQSNYYSPNSSLVDLQNMVQEFDELNNCNNNNNNNNNNSHETLFSEDRSALTNNTNVIKEAKDTTTAYNNNICTGSANDCTSSNEQVASIVSSGGEMSEQLPMNVNGKMSRRERKMQERWSITTKMDSNNEQPSTKAILGVEFPPIAVLRRKFSTSPPPILHPLPKRRRDSSSVKGKTSPGRNDLSQDNIDKLNPSPPPSNSEIHTSTEVNKPNDDQMVDTQFIDTSSLRTSYEKKPNEQLVNASVLSVDEASANEQMTKQKAISTPQECEKEAFSNIYNDRDSDGQMNRNILMTNSCTSTIPSCSSLLSISSSLIHTIENKTSELLPREIVDDDDEEEEQKKKEEEHCDDGDNNGDIEKKNNCNIEHSYHASGTILINNEPTTQAAVLLGQEEKEKERPSSSLSTLEHCYLPCIEDESPAQVISENLDPIAMTIVDDESRYKTIEIEDIPDEDDEENQQASSMPYNHSIKPTDFIFTDDESRLLSGNSPIQTNTIIVEDSRIPADALSKESQIPPSTSTTIKRSQRPEDDPIALRALQRFEQRMSAAAAASKTNGNEGQSLAAKGKSSWSGTLPNPRKSLENLLKDNQQLQSIDIPNDENSTIASLAPTRDTFIRPRKTMLDDIGLHFGMTTNHHHKSDEQQQQQQQSPTALAESNNREVVLEELTKPIHTENCQEQSTITNSPMAHENGLHNEVESSNLLPTPLLDQPSSTVISHSSSEQQPLAPYRLQLEGRRRLNTLERIRERHQNQNSMEQQQQQQPSPLQFHHEHTIKPEQLQDPIIRRALERFDEKSRSLSQAKPTNYDDIQDPITRRALMRLETNLKRTNPTTATSNDTNEACYTNSYTLGSLQCNQDNRFLRYPDSTSPPASNLKPPLPPHISIHQRFCSTLSDTPDLSAGNLLTNNEHDIEVMHVPMQPVYVTSNNHQQQTPINLRQRSRSEDMLSSRNLSLGQTTDIDDRQTFELQRTQSSDELQQQEEEQGEETFISKEIVPNGTELQPSNSAIKPLDPNFVRITEESVNNKTATQTYSAYSCEYTRPHQNQSITPIKSDLSSPRNTQQTQESEIQYPPPSSSPFTHVHPSTNNYYSQRPLPTPSYSSMYTPDNLNQTPYSDDPIVRRALERFNSQMQNSLMSMSQHQPHITPMPRQVFNHGNLDSLCPTEDTWGSFNRPIPSTSGTSTGYQSIIGRRRQIRQDDMYHDPTSVGNAYSTVSFMNSQNQYAIANPYMQFSDEPPAIPPRLHHDMYHEQQEYLSENVNNNNNNNNNNGSIHHAYPATTNGYRPINRQYISPDSFQQFHDDDYLRHRAQSTSSTTSSDSVNPIRLIHQRLPLTATRTHIEQNKNLSPENSQSPSEQTAPNNGSVAGDSVFHRLAYTATKSSLSKSSSNLCANLLNKTPQQQQQTKPNPIKTQDIELDTSTNLDPNQESTSTLTNKCQRSRSVDGRARLKNAQNRAHNNPNNRSTNDDDDQTSSTIPSSKFTPVTPRRDAVPPRLPTTPRTMTSDRVSSAKRVPNGSHVPYPRSGMRTRGSNGNLIDNENDENQALNENYQPKIIDNKSRTSMPSHRYATNNHIQTSASTSSMTSNMSRTRLPIGTSPNLDRRDSNASSTELNRSSKRSDDNRILSPTVQRRNIPVSVFAPAKHPTPIPPSSTSPTATDPLPSYNSESPQEQEHEQTSCSSHSSTGDSSYATINNENEMNQKLSSTNLALKSSTGNILNELSLANDRHDHSKKMNVFERLFRGHKKKI